MIDDGVPDVSDLVDTLINRVGEHSLYRISPIATEVPERSVRRIPPMAPDTGASWPGHWPRPARLFASPEPIETMAFLPDHPPIAFTWRGIRRRVQRADGPERVRGEWWRRDSELTAVRDYFKVEDDAGERYWIFRSGGLANTHGAAIVAARADHRFTSIDDLWRRAGVPSAALVQLAEADAFRPAHGLARRDALGQSRLCATSHYPSSQPHPPARRRSCLR